MLARVVKEAALPKELLARDARRAIQAMVRIARRLDGACNSLICVQGYDPFDQALVGLSDRPMAVAGRGAPLATNWFVPHQGLDPHPDHRFWRVSGGGMHRHPNPGSTQ